MTVSVIIDKADDGAFYENGTGVSGFTVFLVVYVHC